jgi:hypothetical protein
MKGVAKEKATITVDRAKLDRVRVLTGASSASQAIDIALSELIRLERVRRDVAAYTRVPLSDGERALAAHGADWSVLADETDWDAVYADQPG